MACSGSNAVPVVSATLAKAAQRYHTLVGYVNWIAACGVGSATAEGTTTSAARVPTWTGCYSGTTTPWSCPETAGAQSTAMACSPDQTCDAWHAQCGLGPPPKDQKDHRRGACTRGSVAPVCGDAGQGVSHRIRCLLTPALSPPGTGNCGGFSSIPEAIPVSRESAAEKSCACEVCAVSRQMHHLSARYQLLKAQLDLGVAACVSNAAGLHGSTPRPDRLRDAGWIPRDGCTQRQHSKPCALASLCTVCVAASVQLPSCEADTQSRRETAGPAVSSYQVPPSLSCVERLCVGSAILSRQESASWAAFRTYNAAVQARIAHGGSKCRCDSVGSSGCRARCRKSKPGACAGLDVPDDS